MVPYGLSQLILYCVQSKYFTFEDLNDRLTLFNFEPIDKGNRPKCLLKEKLLMGKLGCSASETITFLRYFGLLIGDLVPDDDERWQLYVCLKSISEILSMRFFQRGCITLLKVLITEHHEMYIRFFRNMKPKHHFLLHYPRIIKRIGPIINVWCMRCEAKHKPSKLGAQVTNSRVNIPYSVALKHQLQFSYNLQCNNFLKNEIRFGRTQLLSLEKNPEVQKILPFDFKYDSTIYSISWLEIDSITYKASMILTTNYEDELPLFAAIVQIFMNSEKKFIYVAKKLETVGLNSHVGAYHITMTEKLIAISRDELFNNFPTSIHTAADGHFYLGYNDA